MSASNTKADAAAGKMHGFEGAEHAHELMQNDHTTRASLATEILVLWSLSILRSFPGQMAHAKPELSRSIHDIFGTSKSRTMAASGGGTSEKKDILETIGD